MFLKPQDRSANYYLLGKAAAEKNSFLIPDADIYRGINPICDSSQFRESYLTGSIDRHDDWSIRVRSGNLSIWNRPATYLHKSKSFSATRLRHPYFVQYLHDYLRCL